MISNNKKITIKQVAELAGLSVATVSRVLNSSRPVKPELAEKVWTAVKELNYRPNAAARFMKGQRTGNIALLVPDLSHPFFSAIATGAIMQAQKTDQVIITSTSEGDPEIEKLSIDQLSRSMVDGLIYCPVSAGEPLPEFERFQQLPLVVAGRRGVFENVPHVYTDNVKGGYLATKYFIRLGRNRISFFAGFWSPPCTAENIVEALSEPWAGAYSTLDRFIGYLKALEEENIPYDPSLVIICGYDYKAGYNATRELLGKMLEVDSILAPNDMVASGVLSLLDDQGIRVPEEISVIGYDDNLIATLTKPKLTSVKQNPREIGACAVNILNRRLNKKEVSDKVVDVTLSIRSSTSAPGNKSNS